jgi:hypothetical protein
MWECFLLNWGIIITLALLLAISEALDEIPAIKSSSIHKVILVFLRASTNRLKKKGD